MAAPYISTQLQGISDLVVVAPIKQGLVEGALDSVTYLQRLDRVLRLLNRGRSASREAATKRSPFSDLVGRLNIVHFFRFAIVPPLRENEPHRLLLNVTFDGGWEAYMRVIWRDLGPLLDLICCHCERYPLAHTSSFAEYIAWVREHEAQAGFFYADSGSTIGDQRYDTAIEAMSRANGPGNLDARIARHRVKTSGETLADATAAARRDRFAAVAAGVRSTVAFHSLTRLFPGFAGLGDAGILLRFAKELHPEFMTLIREGVFGEPEFAPVKVAAAEALAWLNVDTEGRVIPADRLPTDPAELLKQTQVGVLGSYPQVTHGCLALLRIEGKPVSDVIRFLEQWPVSSGTDQPSDRIYRAIAFTHAGLAALGVPARRLALFPQEFIDGMEARAGILGDIRGNHPQHWQRPLRNWPPGDASPVPIELGTVHVVVQLRTHSDAASADDLLPEFATELNKFAEAGLTVLAWQPMRRDQQGGVLRDHFGFADGLSQPTLEKVPTIPPYWSDTVPTGEILVGYRNSRDDGPYPTKADPLLDKGSFLVVRKLKQDVARLNQLLTAEVEKLEPNLEEQKRSSNVNEIKERMMGRRLNGDPMVKEHGKGNNFNYAGDEIGAQCPFQSHVRRTNPRHDPRMPRIMRRGMSYGPRFGAGTEQKERGLMFMAYNASIAEQFEVIQRWIAGGNSSGISSEQSDPFLGVPEPGQPRLFRCPVGNKVVRIDLGDKPIVQLQWGLYLFAPSIEALRELNAAVTFPPPAEEAPQSNTPLTAPTPIAATEADVLTVLREPGQIFSVRGYGDRLSQSVGNGHLGQDPHDPDRKYADEVNQLIASISEADAFKVAHLHAVKYLERFLAMQRVLPGMDRLALEGFIDYVLGKACQEWFGLPDEKGEYMTLASKTANPDEPARCPGHFYAVARYVFSPTPTPTDEMLGKAHGKILRAAAQRFVDDHMPDAGPLSREIAAIIGPGDPDRVARTIVGVMLGFPPTTGGNLMTVLGTWLTTRDLWNLQRALLPLPSTQVYEHASRVLQTAMLKTMCQRPVPSTIWRTAVAPCTVGGTEINAQTKVPVALGKALEKGASPEIMFGRAPQEPPTVHGCPGRSMALGLMLGTICALLSAGQLQPAGDPLSVFLRPMP